MKEHILGLSLGRVHEPSGLAAVEVESTNGDERYLVRELVRFAAGTRYREIAETVAAFATTEPYMRRKVSYVPHTGGSSSVRRVEHTLYPSLAIDRTGAGESVAAMFRERMPPAMTVFNFVLTAGDAGTHGGVRRYPRRDLAGYLQIIVQERRIKVRPELEHAETLAREMGKFKARISLSAKDEDVAWREGEHDDLVLALAAAVYHTGRAFPPIGEEAARVLAGLSDYRGL